MTPWVHNNRILKSLSSELLEQLRPLYEPVSLKIRDMLEPADTPIEYVYFPESGLASVVAQLPGDRPIELGVIGREGMTGIAIVQGDNQSPYETFVQMSGAAIRMPAAGFLAICKQNPELQKHLQLYVRAFGIQVTSTALANGRSKLEERLARWLLMVHDRADGDRFQITHEFLAIMLGVRRPGVTVALQMLEGRGLVRARRGEVQVADREGLIALSNGAYGMAEAEYERLLGPAASHRRTNGSGLQPLEEDQGVDQA